MTPDGIEALTHKTSIFRRFRELATGALLSRLFWGGVLSLLIQFQYQIVRLLSGIVLARVMGPSDLGIYSFTMALITLVQIVPLYGVDSVVIRFSAIYRSQESWELLRGLWRTGYVASIGYGILVAGAAFSLTALGWLKPSAAFSPAVLAIAAISMLFRPILTYFGAVLRVTTPGVTGQLPQFAVLPWMFLVLVVVVVLAFRLPMSAELAVGLQGLAVVATVVVAAILFMKYRPRPLRTVRPRRELARWLRSASSFWVLGGLDVIFSQADILMLGTLATARETGIYRIATNGANLLLLSGMAANLYLGPRIPEMYARGEFARIQRLLSLWARGAFAMSLIVACVIWLWGGALIRFFFGAAYGEAYWPLAILCLGQLAYVGSGPGDLLLSMTGHERLAAAIAGGAAICNIALNAALIPWLGATGSALATTIALLIWRGLLSMGVKRATGLNISIFAGARQT